MHIYISYFKSGMWSAPSKFDILNSQFNDETPFISRDGKTIVFSSDRDGSRELTLPGGGKMVSYDIYWSHLIDNKWSTPELIPGFINSVYHEKAPSLNNDNQTIYFSRWAPGDIKNSRILYSKFVNGRFSEPEMMPREINSGNMEMALIPDGKDTGFYFSSRRDGGLGGWDIYFISVRNGHFGFPVNLGENINSEFDEAFFSVLNGRIYFSSNQPSAGKNYDIVEAFLPGQKQLLFKVTDLNNLPVQTTIEIDNIFQKKLPEILHHKTSDHGDLVIPIDDDIDTMDIFIEEKGYLPYYRKIEKSELLNPQFDLVLTPVKNESSFSIESIYFDYEKSDIKNESLPYLDRLAVYLQNNPSMKIKIIGHTDLHGTDEYNLELSKNRAMAVQKYLEKKGIAHERLDSMGAGKSNPVLNEISYQADKLNRRTEFKVSGD